MNNWFSQYLALSTPDDAIAVIEDFGYSVYNVANADDLAERIDEFIDAEGKEALNEKVREIITANVTFSSSGQNLRALGHHDNTLCYELRLLGKTYGNDRLLGFPCSYFHNEKSRCLIKLTT